MVCSYDVVKAEICSRLGGLVRGGIEAAVLEGRGWRTPLGLTCREIRLVVPEGARLDYSALLQGKLALTDRARGSVDIIFDEADFGNFLVYPKVAAATLSAGGPFTFSREGIRVDPGRGAALFCGHHRGREVFAALERLPSGADGEVAVRVLDGVDPQDAPALERALTDFFRNLSVELAGMALRMTGVHFVNVEGGRSGVRVRFEGEIVRIPDPMREQM